jgi:hypothetical protein
MGFVDDFFNTLQTYNETVYAITILTYLLGLLTIYLVSRRSNQASKGVSVILSFLWAWSGLIFHVLFFGPTNVEFLGMTMPGVWYFSGFLFILQSLLFITYGWVKSALFFSFDISPCSVVGAIFVIYAMLIYPLIGVLTGYTYPRYPLFGSSPCPVTIFTWGLLLWTNKKIPLRVSIVPFIWGIMGIMPVIVLGVYADIGLILTSIIGFPLILLHNRSIQNRQV